MADWDFGKATSWAELQHVHDRWARDFNEQEHWAHQQRLDGRRSPKDVLDWVIGTPHDLAALAQLFAPVRHERRLDRSGYVQFRRWRVYGERGLAKQTSLVWLSDETLTVGYGQEPLSYYTVKVDRRGRLTKVTEPRLLPTGYQPAQARLWAWTPNSEEWLLAL